MKHHPGDWVFLASGGRMIALSHAAYVEGWEQAQHQDPDVWAELRAKGRAMADMIQIILDIMVRDGRALLERRAVIGGDDVAMPVYVLAAEAPEVEPRQRPKLRVVEPVGS